MKASHRQVTNTDMVMACMSTDPLALLRLMHLVSPALPIGAFNFSQGLE